MLMTRLTEFCPNLWIYELETPDFVVRAAVIKGEQRAVVWDTMSLPDEAAPLADALDGQPYYVVYSHGDYDHAWGTAGLGEGGLGVIAHAECLRRFRDEVPRTLQRMQMAEPSLWESVRLILPNITFTARLSLDLGGLTVELHHIPGHTADSIVAWIPERGVLLGGDAIETPLPVVNHAPLLLGWLDALAAWQDNDRLEYAIPSHGSASGRESLDATVAYLRALTGDRQFRLPRKLDDFYLETHQKNLNEVLSWLAPHG